jgi:hypothetical protein
MIGGLIEQGRHIISTQVEGGSGGGSVVNVHDGLTL